MDREVKAVSLYLRRCLLSFGLTLSLVMMAWCAAIGAWGWFAIQSAGLGLGLVNLWHETSRWGA